MRINPQVTNADASIPMIGIYGSGFAPSPYVTPNTIFERYSVPISTRGTVSMNSQCVVAFEDQFIDVAGDLRNFARDMGIKYIQPTIDGLNDPTQPGGESTLDIQVRGRCTQQPSRESGVATDRVLLSFLDCSVHLCDRPRNSDDFLSLSVSSPAGSGGPAKPPGDGAYILEWAAHVSDLTTPLLVTSILYGEDAEVRNFSCIDRMEVELACLRAYSGRQHFHQAERQHALANETASIDHTRCQINLSVRFGQPALTDATSFCFVPI
jgi:hypothetical protein